jgi:trk system potassium uptake protein TrkA
MKFCVIGLGKFGYSVATALANHGLEVIAIDSDMAIVSSIKDKVTHAICMRVTDEASLKSIGIEHVNTVIISIGDDFAQAVLTTVLCKKKLGIQQVIARTTSELKKEILQLIGADQIIMPEQEIGVRLANSLSSSSKIK